MTRTSNMSPNLRRRDRKANYAEFSNSESDSDISDPNYSRSRSPRQTRSKDTTLSNPKQGRGVGQGEDTPLCTSRARKTTIARHVRGHGRGGRGRRRGGGRQKQEEEGDPSVKSIKKTILSWLIECELIEEDEQVCYMDVTKESATKTGRITRGGILCNCCQRETSVWTFEKHAGSDLGRPYEHIYILRKGLCLQDCQIAAWQDARERNHRNMFSYVPKETGADQNDDACSICGDRADLIHCDKCLSRYHAVCLNMERVPLCDWLCPYCICKYCGLGGESKQFITCSHCDKKFHWGCFKKFEKEFAKETLDDNCSTLYCGPVCREMYEKLEGSLGIRNDNFASYSWRVIRPMNMTPKADSAAKNLYLENNSKVAVAWMLMNEAFETIIDRHTGINMVQSVVYSCGSNLTRVDFSRFYTFVLEEDDEIIAAASIRFHGRRIAEMPFIATDKAYRGKGICRSLMRVIESFLRTLKVENWIIPSVGEISEMWKHKFSFTDVSEELKRELPSYNILMLPRALRLYKDISTCIAGSGNDDEDNETGSQNGQETQTNQVETPLLDLNMDAEQEG